MDTWYSLQVGKEDAMLDLNAKICDAFFREGITLKCAAFFIYDLIANAETIYFTPEAHEIARSFKAVPCPKPPCCDVGFVAGDWRCWQSFVRGCDGSIEAQPG